MSVMSSPMYRTSIDLDSSNRMQLVNLMNQELADLFDLQSQTKQAHWNVKGMQFIALHELFDDLAETLEDYIDSLAERITALGGTALGTARMSASASRLSEYPIDAVSGQSHLEALVERYALVAANVRAASDNAAALADQSTADLFTEISRGMDKHLWLLEAHLQD